jgi:hypothetical protein
MSTQDTAAKTAARAAAEWWATQVGAPVFRNTGETDSPEDRRNGDLVGMMQTLLASRHPVTDEAGTKFADELERRIDSMLARIDWVSLSVDYGPDFELAEPAQAAGISLSRFPWKTHMSVTKDYVTAALGYQAPARLVRQHPDWERPPCGSVRYTVEGYAHPDNTTCSLPKYHDGEHGEWKPNPARCEKCGGTYVDHFGSADRKDHSWGGAW